MSASLPCPALIGSYIFTILRFYRVMSASLPCPALIGSRFRFALPIMYPPSRLIFFKHKRDKNVCFSFLIILRRRGRPSLSFRLAPSSTFCLDCLFFG